MKGVCRFCGLEGRGMPFYKWVKPTFTDWDKLQPGSVACDECLFWFNERSEELAQRVGKEKPQRMRNYSHFIKDGEWTPLSKGDKARMAKMLLSTPFPELAAIAVSGQKHIVFRAPRNAPGQASGWVQVEEHSVFVEPEKLCALLDAIEELYKVFSKGEIERGDYAAYRILKLGIERWQELESQLRTERGGQLFGLALFLAQKRGEHGNDKGNSERAAHTDMAGGTGGLQEQVPDDHLESVRERDTQRGLHQQSGQVRQLDLFEIAGDDRT